MTTDQEKSGTSFSVNLLGRLNVNKPVIRVVEQDIYKVLGEVREGLTVAGAVVRYLTQIKPNLKLTLEDGTEWVVEEVRDGIRKLIIHVKALTEHMEKGEARELETNSINPRAQLAKALEMGEAAQRVVMAYQFLEELAWVKSWSLVPRDRNNVGDWRIRDRAWAEWSACLVWAEAELEESRVAYAKVLEKQEAK